MQRTITVRRLQDQRSNDDLAAGSPADRIGMVWPLTASAWAFKEAADRTPTGEPDAQRRLPRHAVRFRKRGR